MNDSNGIAIHMETGSKMRASGDEGKVGDKDTRKLTNGYLFIINGPRQSVVVFSSTEAEYIGSSEAAKEAIRPNPYRNRYAKARERNQRLREPVGAGHSLS